MVRSAQSQAVAWIISAALPLWHDMRCGRLNKVIQSEFQFAYCTSELVLAKHNFSKCGITFGSVYCPRSNFSLSKWLELIG